MSTFKDGRQAITLDRERHLLFSLNVLDELQDRAGGIDKLEEFLSTEGGGANIKNLKWLLTALINEGDNDGEELTEKQVGKLIHMENLNEITAAVFSAFSKGTGGDAEPATDSGAESEESGTKKKKSKA